MQALHSICGRKLKGGAHYHGILSYLLQPHGRHAQGSRTLRTKFFKRVHPCRFDGQDAYLLRHTLFKAGYLPRSGARLRRPRAVPGRCTAGTDARRRGARHSDGRIRRRAYEDTLAEYTDILTAAGFRCTAGVAAVARHSIFPQFAAGRPRLQRMPPARRLCPAGARRAGRRHGTPACSAGQQALPASEGNGPEAARGHRLHLLRPVRPAVSGGGYPLHAPAQTDTALCIGCMRCAAVCPVHARRVDGAALAAARKGCKRPAKTAKQSELFL